MLWPLVGKSAVWAEGKWPLRGNGSSWQASFNPVTALELSRVLGLTAQGSLSIAFSQPVGLGYRKKDHVLNVR